MTLPPSTPLMIGLYQSILVPMLMSIKVADFNTVLVFGMIAFGVQLIFWIFAGLWGFTNTQLKFSELRGKLVAVRDELFAKDHPDADPSPVNETPLD